MDTNVFAWVTPDCPVCGKSDQVYFYDRGLKLFARLLVLDNRFGCRTCRVSWRRRNPELYIEMREHRKGSRPETRVP